MRPVLAGSQTGGASDYDELQQIADEDTLIVDDLTAGELAAFCRKGGVDLLIGGVKERPIALKLGIAFCDITTNANTPSLASAACSPLPRKFTTPLPHRSGIYFNANYQGGTSNDFTRRHLYQNQNSPSFSRDQYL